jgi:uncharacterized protein YjbI with pentapeptide repeats
MQKAKLGKAMFYEAELIEINFRQADLEGASFPQSSLKNVDLRQANLRGTDFSKASMTGLKMEGADYDITTKWPAGFDPEKIGVRKIG